jgi:hypothetical protein
VSRLSASKSSNSKVSLCVKTDENAIPVLVQYVFEFVVHHVFASCPSAKPSRIMMMPCADRAVFGLNVTR